MRHGLFILSHFIYNVLPLPCYLVPSSRGRLLVIPMTVSLQASRSLVSAHSSVSVQFVMALMSSSHRARGLPLFLAPPPIPNIIDFSKLFSLRMMCPKYDMPLLYTFSSFMFIPHCTYFLSCILFFLSSCTRNLAHKSQCCKYTLTEPHAPTMHVTHTPSTADAFSGRNN